MPPTCGAAPCHRPVREGTSRMRSLRAGIADVWSRIISCGAEVVLDTCDYLAACLDDPNTDSVVLFVEGFKRFASRWTSQSLAVRSTGGSPQALAARVGAFKLARCAGDAQATDAAASRRRDPLRLTSTSSRGGTLLSRSRRIRAATSGAREDRRRVAGARPVKGRSSRRPRSTYWPGPAGDPCGHEAGDLRRPCRPSRTWRN